VESQKLKGQLENQNRRDSWKTTSRKPQADGAVLGVQKRMPKRSNTVKTHTIRRAKARRPFGFAAQAKGTAGKPKTEGTAGKPASPGLWLGLRGVVCVSVCV